MAERLQVLVVEDDWVSRKILVRILSSAYEVIEAANGYAALDILNNTDYSPACMVLDLVMPVMDGFELLDRIQLDPRIKDIPVVVASAGRDGESEQAALSHGAWDYVVKPYNAQILMFRIKNVIERSRMSAFQQLKYLSEFDPLTGIYNGERFSRETEKLIKKHPDKSFIICRCDIDRFHLINSYYGRDTGDRLLKYVANRIKAHAKTLELCVYGRLGSDVFSLCSMYLSKQRAIGLLRRFESEVRKFELSFDISMSFGLHIIGDDELSAEKMLGRAKLAALSAKGNYLCNYAFFNIEMEKKIEDEQEINNEMTAALNNRQFCVYIQPKYNIAKGVPEGGEALVRWRHPKKGLRSPGEFVPAFEKNGFITKVDMFVWEEVCSLLRRWIDSGLSPMPVSVNVSRANLSNPKIVGIICSLTEKYSIPPELLQLEITESAYIENPTIIGQAVSELREHGFSIMMDDFGSGYSSLNMLKDVEFDYLKIDLKLLASSKIEGRGENIISSVIRMAKWLRIPVIAECVETDTQVSFLKSIGCEYVQGYFFAEPMEPDEYIRLEESGGAPGERQGKNYDIDFLWTVNPQTEILFNNAVQPSALYETDGSYVECVRVNNALMRLFGEESCRRLLSDAFFFIAKEHTDYVKETFFRAAQNCEDGECEYLSRCDGGKLMWVRLKLRHIAETGGKHIFFGSLSDVTALKTAEAQLAHYKSVLHGGKSAEKKMLVVDDEAKYRATLREIFSAYLDVAEATGGQEALDYILCEENSVDIILLDLNMSPMDGYSFLCEKNKNSAAADIPVIVMTDGESDMRKMELLSAGADDFIEKPLLRELAEKRVDSAIGESGGFRTLVKEYKAIADMAQTDYLTGLLNRSAAQVCIADELKRESTGLHGLIILDIDNFKDINDKYGHICGDKILGEFSEKLASFFRSSDIIGRMGGDEFCVLMKDIIDGEAALAKCKALCKRISEMKFSATGESITCSAGIAVTEEGISFNELYSRADNALYEAKRLGRNRAVYYRSGV